MSLTHQRTWLIAYDIRDPRRLSRLHAFIIRHTIPVQYSVYLFEGHAGELGSLLANIRSRIDNRVDDVRAYFVPENAEIHMIGRASFPHSAIFSSQVAPSVAVLTKPAAAWYDSHPPS